MRRRDVGRHRGRWIGQARKSRVREARGGGFGRLAGRGWWGGEPCLPRGCLRVLRLPVSGATRRAARHPGGGLARPGEKPGSVRTHLRRRSPRGSPQGPAGAEVAGPGTKSVARGVRRNPPDGGADLPILPRRAKPPARAGEDAPRAPLSSFEGRAACRTPRAAAPCAPPRAASAAGTRACAQPRARRRLTAFVSRSTVRRRGEGAPLEAMMGQRDRSLRQYLMAYGAALLVPVLLLAVVLVWQFARAEEVQNEEKARAAAQQIIAAVDRELAGLQAAGLALASSAALRAGNFERVQRRAAEIIRALPHPQNYAIVVRDLTGQQLVNTRVPWGTPLPKGADPDADKEVIETRLPFVQDLFTGATANRPVLSVRVPVLADEGVTHVLWVVFGA